LVQTAAYARALLAVGPRPPQWEEPALAARLRRQQILDWADGTAPRLVAVITEASLMHPELGQCAPEWLWMSLRPPRWPEPPAQRSWRWKVFGFGAFPDVGWSAVRVTPAACGYRGL
jgi:Domain of unknown function (DUF5753)